MGKSFKFENGQQIKISVSGEVGKVTGRADYLEGENRYLVQYRAADGCAKECWWTEGSLEAAE